jgi:DNA modification methylase
MQPYFNENGITIYHGDCREILPALPHGLIATDPPYNVGYHYDGYKDNLSVEEYQELIRAACPLPCVLIHYPEDLCAISWTLEEIPDEMVAWVYNANTARQWRGIAWWGVKPDFTRAGQPYKNQSDKRIATLMEQGRSARLYDWWEINQVKNVGEEKTAHPCQIPLLVMERILKITPPPHLVIDPFLGSGTTLRAAKNLGLKAVGVEIEEKYCEIAAKRLSQHVLDFAAGESC